MTTTMAASTNPAQHVHSSSTIRPPHACLCSHPLLFACAQGSCTQVKKALSDSSLDVNERGPSGSTALHFAVRAATPCTRHIAKMLLT